MYICIHTYMYIHPADAPRRRLGERPALGDPVGHGAPGREALRMMLHK